MAIKDRDDGTPFKRVVLDEYIPGCHGRVRSDFFPGEKQQGLSFAFHVEYKDVFLIDGVSVENQCIKRIMAKKKGHNNAYWRGNVIVIKSTKSRDPAKYPSYLDMGPEDVMDAIEFVLEYAVASSA
jgi:hypothetical protein